jgi:CheY-like chemotaxis protein
VTVEPARALLVDDRRENLVALEAILQGLPVETVSVTSGEAALKQLLSDDFAVILLDASMPTMDGFETATHIKQRERTRHIPIIFLTALNYDARLAFRYQIGAVDYITKPFDPWVLRSKVAVFVDLWLKTAELSAQRATLHTAITKALAHLTATPPDPAAAIAALQNAQGHS